MQLKTTLTALAVTLGLAASFQAYAEDDSAMLKGVMVTSKVAGMCGTLRQMSLFQESTQMENGDEFLMRFIKTEATRLGETEEEFHINCIKSTKQYKEYWEAVSN